MNTTQQQPITGPGIAAKQKIIRELSPQFLGLSGAIAQFTKKPDTPTPIVPFKMPEDIFLSTVERNGKDLKIQVEITEYIPGDDIPFDMNTDSSNENAGAREPQVFLGRVYTADDQMLDMELTRSERSRIEDEYLEKKSQEN